VSELERLKSLLLTPERERIQRLDDHAASLQQSLDNLPMDLPGLLERAHLASAPGRLGRAIAEPVADALGEAVSRRRQSIVDALFPVIMPAIRRAIAEYLRVLSADINRLLESSFTPRGIGWRIESWRSGVPYAEIAIKHSLRYRVDYLLLIQSESGLVLDREHAADVPELDSDAIAGMLTAIGDFVRDSVSGGEGDRLSSATVGEHLLWVLEGPRAKLAAFIRGVPPEALKTVLQARLESVHARFGDDLSLAPDQISGHPEIRDALTPDDLRSSQDVDAAAAEAPSTRGLWLIAAVIAALIGAWVVASWRWNQRIERVEASLRQWPGFYLAGIDTQPWRSVRISGLLDPLAVSPLTSLRQGELSGIEVALDVQGFMSTHPDMGARRLRAALNMPDSVTIAPSSSSTRFAGAVSIIVRDRLKPESAALLGMAPLDLSGLRWDLAASLRDLIGIPDGVVVEQIDSTWRLSGSVDADWRARLDEVLARYPEFGKVDRSSLLPLESSGLEVLNQQLLANPVPFVTGVTLSDEANRHIEALVAVIQSARLLAQSADRKLIVDIFGINDALGTDAQNAALREQRARFLQDQLQQRLDFSPDFRLHAESTALVATIRSRAALAQLRFE
jgi:hypothetical protein